MLNHREKSDRSFQVHEQSFLSACIGITSNHAAVGCLMNIHDKSYQYYRTRQQIMEALNIIDNKLKQWAFNRIQKSVQFQTVQVNSKFLPEALNNGDYSTLTKFLEKLKTNRVGSYVKLNIGERAGFFGHGTKITQILVRIIRQRKQQGFISLKEYYQNHKNRVLYDIDNISSIENKDSQPNDFIPRIKANKQINVQYTLIQLNPEFMAKNKQEISFSKINGSGSYLKTTRKDNKEISIRQLLPESIKKEYCFQKVFGKYQRIKSQKKHYE